MSGKKYYIERILHGRAEIRNFSSSVANRPILAPRRRTPIPTPRRNVRQLIQYFESNPIFPLIGLFRLPLRETATTTEYQPLGQELMKNDGL